MLDTFDDLFNIGRRELDAVLERPPVRRFAELLNEIPLEQTAEWKGPPREGPARDFVRRLCALAREHRDIVRECLYDLFASDVAVIIANLQESNHGPLTDGACEKSLSGREEEAGEQRARGQGEGGADRAAG